MLRNVWYKLCVVVVCLLLCTVTPAFAIRASDSYNPEVRNTQIGNDIGGLNLKNKFNLLNKNSYLNKIKLNIGLKEAKNVVLENINSDNTKNIYGKYNLTRSENRSEIRYSTTGCLDELNTAYTSTCDSINYITVELSELKSNITSINNEIKEIEKELDNHISTIDSDSPNLTGLNEKRIELLESRKELINNENKLEKLNNLLKTKKIQINNCKQSLDNLEKTEDKKTVIDDYNTHLKTINQINNGIKETNNKLTHIETTELHEITTENNVILTIEDNEILTAENSEIVKTENSEIVKTENSEIVKTENSEIVKTGNNELLTTVNKPNPTTNNNSTTNNKTNTTNDEPPIEIASKDYSTKLYSIWGTSGGLTTIGLSLIASANAWRIYRTAVVDKTLISYTTHLLGKIGDRTIPELLTRDLIEGNIANWPLIRSHPPDIRAGLTQLMIDDEVTSYTKMLSKLKSTESGNNFLIGKLSGLGLEIEDTPTLVNKIVYLGSKEESVGRDLFTVAQTFTKIKADRTIELCNRCKAILYTGKVLSAFSVVMDIYTVASLVSWAGKGMGWWKKDYVNDYTIGLLCNLF